MTYYDTSEKLTALLTAATAWHGTPFRENSAIPGPRGGVSCHNLVAAIYVATGALPPFAVPRGSARRLLHNPADTIIDFIAANFPDHFLHIHVPDTPSERLADVCAGDLLVFAERKVSKHVAIAIPGAQPHHTLRIAHVLMHSGCTIDSQLADPTYLNALVDIWRPLAATPNSKL